ncbi:MAG: acetyl-CoA carboxylase biotin carboxyl carrier protein subunit [Anaerolineae bacterium]|nr:acetyl-CoA carboxylase biotin carboxyl carrier protein subunit [Anaerolineae bacterium]
MTSFSYVFQSETYAVDLERLPDGRWRAVIEGRDYIFTAHLLADGGWQLRLDDRNATAYVEAEGNRRFVCIDGAQRMLEVAERDLRSRRKIGVGSDDARLTAQMPGQVRAVHVAAGDSVSRGQTLVILEAMKMELRVTAPVDATIQRVHVQSGDVVERDALLVELKAVP